MCVRKQLVVVSVFAVGLIIPAPTSGAQPDGECEASQTGKLGSAEYVLKPLRTAHSPGNPLLGQPESWMLSPNAGGGASDNGPEILETISGRQMLEAFSKLHPGDQLRIERFSATRASQGTFVGQSDRVVLLGRGPQTISVPMRDIWRIELRDRTGAIAEGIVVGGMCGALVGGMIGWGIYDSMDPLLWGEPENKPGSAILTGAAVGFIVGGALGIVAAEHLREWRRIYPIDSYGLQTSPPTIYGHFEERFSAELASHVRGRLSVGLSYEF